MIATKNKEPYYWTSEGTAEIDFILEIKAGANNMKKSLLIRTTTMNLKHDGAIYTARMKEKGIRCSLKHLIAHHKSCFTVPPKNWLLATPFSQWAPFS